MQPTSIADALATMTREPPRQSCEIRIRIVEEPERGDADDQGVGAHPERRPGQAVTEDGSTFDDLECVLVPESWTSAEPKRVAVVIGGRHVGHLPPPAAVDYFPALQRLAAEKNRLATGRATVVLQLRDDGRIGARVTVILPPHVAFEGDPGTDGHLIDEVAPISQTDNDWIRFQRDLADALQGLEEDEFLIIAAKQSGLFVQFAAQGRFGMRVEAASNAYISDARERLDAGQVAQMARLGWKAPTGTAAQEQARELGPDGSPNFYVDEPYPPALEILAGRAVQTLRHVYRIDHPGMLRYRAFNMAGEEIRFPGLRIRREGAS